MDMNHYLSHLSIMSLGVGLLGLLGLALGTYCMLLRLVSDLSKVRNSMNQASWGYRLSSLLITVLRGLPLACVGATLLWISWFDWRESALTWAIALWLSGITMVLAVRILGQRFPAPSVLEPDFQPRLVTAGNCAEFGLTPEQVQGMIAELMAAARQAQPEEEAGQPAAAAGVEVTHQN